MITISDLIKALSIFVKYKNERCPTHCEHDVMYVCGIEKEEVSEEDLKKLDELGFYWDDEEEYFYSFRFGSC